MYETSEQHSTTVEIGVAQGSLPVSPQQIRISLVYRVEALPRNILG